MYLIKEILTLIFIFPIIIFFGGYLSYKLKFIQITKIPLAFRLIFAKEKKEGISSFQALSTVLGGNLGTGNISGVAVAISSGGPGALFWMWVMVLFASLTKYTDAFLGVHFQRKDDQGEWVSGPMYFLQQGLKSKFLAYAFCLATILSSLSVGNLVQVNALSLPLSQINLPPLIFGFILAAIVGGVIWGGIKSFAHVASSVVPLMAVLYTLSCLIILVLSYEEIIPSIKLIWHSAFSLKPAAGGLLGFSVFSAIRSGFDRGLFATDSGLGLSAILHGAVYEKNEKIDNRIKQGLISVLSPVIVMTICTLTGLVLLSTKAYLSSSHVSTNMCMEAFRLGFGFDWAGHIITITLLFFAFTTILTWSFCADKAIEFMWGRKYIHLFQIFFIGLIPLGAVADHQWVWTVADISINFMFIINMIGIIYLCNIVIMHSKKFFTK